jgi:hypothetical protein
LAAWIPGLRVTELRGGLDLSEASVTDPTVPAVITTTIDQLGSRLLFRAYGANPVPSQGAGVKMRPRECARNRRGRGSIYKPRCTGQPREAGACAQPKDRGRVNRGAQD